MEYGHCAQCGGKKKERRAAASRSEKIRTDVDMPRATDSKGGILSSSEASLHVRDRSENTGDPQSLHSVGMRGNARLPPKSTDNPTTYNQHKQESHGP